MSIQVKGLTHIYSQGMPYESVAIKDVSFEVGDGEFLGIIGHTGSGKSTLVQHLNGLIKPLEGSVVIDGEDITGEGVVMRDLRRKVGLVFQYPEYQLFEETVHKDVAFGPLNLGLSQEDADLRVIEAIKMVGLDYEDIAQRSPFDLSGGQKRRVAIAGVVAMRPKVLILDEPTAGLDPKAHDDILTMIRKIHKESNNIIILVSHNMGDIAELSDKVLVMERGALAMSGTPREVFAQSEKLVGIGLSVPPAAELIRQMRIEGVNINADVLDLDEAEEELFRYLKDKV